MAQKPESRYNPWFLYPFLLWGVVGGFIVFAYDRVVVFTYINGHYSSLLNELMYHATKMGQAEVIVPVLASLMLIKRFRTWWYFTLGLACNVVPIIVLQSLKSLFDRPRPMHYFQHTTWVHILEHWDRYFARSFPSGHSEGAFSFFCFLSLLLLPRYKAWGIVFFILALLVCYSRVYLTAHFFEDVYVGSIIGVTVSTTVYVLMYRYLSRYFKHVF